jgi:hypothetical protein
LGKCSIRFHLYVCSAAVKSTDLDVRAHNKELPDPFGNPKLLL